MKRFVVLGCLLACGVLGAGRAEASGSTVVVSVTPMLSTPLISGGSSPSGVGYGATAGVLLSPLDDLGLTFRAGYLGYSSSQTASAAGFEGAGTTASIVPLLGGLRLGLPLGFKLEGELGMAYSSFRGERAWTRIYAVGVGFDFKLAELTASLMVNDWSGVNHVGMEWDGVLGLRIPLISI